MILTGVVFGLTLLVTAAVAILVAFETSPLMRHCILKALSIGYHHPSHARASVVWVLRLVFDNIVRPFRSQPKYDERVIEVDTTKLPSLVSNNTIGRLQAYIGMPTDIGHALMTIERNLVRTAIDNARHFDIRMIPDLFLNNGLVNGPHIIPVGTVLAVYYATLCQKSTRDEESSYVFIYGKFPPSVSRLEFDLDGKQRMHVNPDSNAVFANHKCRGANAKFDWININLVLVAETPIMPFENITTHYGPFYLLSELKMKNATRPTMPCMCEAPNPCSAKKYLYVD